MLNQQELQVMNRIAKNNQLAVETIHPVLSSLEQRGYIFIYPAKTIFGTETGLYGFQLTEAGEAIIA